MAHLLSARTVAQEPSGRALPAYAGKSPDRIQQRLEHDQFLMMERMFSTTGGSFASDDLIQCLRATTNQPISTLARWIVGRQIVTFEWQHRVMAPVFQFEAKDMTVRFSVTRILAQLANVFDDWSLALWFAQPNGWLNGAAPARVISTDADAVYQAARADRFVALGGDRASK